MSTYKHKQKKCHNNNLLWLKIKFTKDSKKSYLRL